MAGVPHLTAGKLLSFPELKNCSRDNPEKLELHLQHMLHKILRVRNLHLFLCSIRFCTKILRRDVIWFWKSEIKQGHKPLPQLIFSDMLNPVLVHSAVPALTEKDYRWVAPACWVHTEEYNNNIHSHSLSYPNEFPFIQCSDSQNLQNNNMHIAPL